MSQHLLTHPQSQKQKQEASQTYNPRLTHSMSVMDSFLANLSLNQCNIAHMS
jgi:hypothetical protein